MIQAITCRRNPTGMANVPICKWFFFFLNTNHFFTIFSWNILNCIRVCPWRCSPLLIRLSEIPWRYQAQDEEQYYFCFSQLLPQILEAEKSNKPASFFPPSVLCSCLGTEHGLSNTGSFFFFFLFLPCWVPYLKRLIKWFLYMAASPRWLDHVIQPRPVSISFIVSVPLAALEHGCLLN